MKTPPPSEAERCLQLRILAKQGRLSDDSPDWAFLKKMRKTYPAWYKDIEYDVFCQSAPIGASIPSRERWFGKQGEE